MMHPDQAHWNYSDDDPLGPSGWPKYFETGSSQSPINIIVDHCYLRYHSLRMSTKHSLTTKPVDLHEQLGRKLVVRSGDQRRDHLDSVGNDDDDDDYEERPSRRVDHANRSPSTSSQNSSVSIESNASSNELTPADRLDPSMRRHLNQHHDHHRQDYHSQPTTKYCGTNKKIFLGYPRYLNSIKLSNTGHGWQVEMPSELACHTILTGPPLGDREYRLAQFHCHWGADYDHGSEHQVNGQSFSAEIHFVHWNCRQFKSIEEASRHKHGLAVLGVFVQALEGEQNRNKHLDKIIAGLAEVKDKPHGSTTIQDSRLDLKKFFPSNRWNYATYEGSLTTPPLSECVDWLVFLQPITCSSSQIDSFRRMKCPSGTLIKNCRPIQPLNKRLVTIWTHHSDQS